MPENYRYEDDGCSVHPHCLTCPLARCRYDVPGGLGTLRLAQRNASLIQMLEQMPAQQVAELAGLSRRSIFRIKAKGAARH